MIDTNFLLTDEQMAEFIVKGFLVLQNELPAEIHNNTMLKILEVIKSEGNLGNNMLARIPETASFFETPIVKGALTSVLGPDYCMHTHRHFHYNAPSPDKPFSWGWHKDGFWSSMRSHRPWWAMIFYFTQDITEEMGPTAVISGSQYYENAYEGDYEFKLPSGKAGTMVLVHFDAWHSASHNITNLDRYMLKFQFVRLHEPEYPSWNHTNADLILPESVKGLSPHRVIWEDVWNWLRGNRSKSFDNEPVSKEQIESLIIRLQLGEPAERQEASDVLGLLEDHAVEAAPLLKTLVGDKAEPVGLNAAYALGRMGKVGLQLLTELLIDGSDTEALRASYGLQGGGEAAVPGLVQVLLQPEEYRRGLAAFALGMLGKYSYQAVPALVERLKDESEWVRRNAAEALGMIRQPVQTIVPALIQALETSLAIPARKMEMDGSAADIERYLTGQGYIQNKISYTCSLSLLRLAGDGDPRQLVPALKKALKSDERYTQAYAVEALSHIRSDEAVEALIDVIRASRWCQFTGKRSLF